VDFDVTLNGLFSIGNINNMCYFNVLVSKGRGKINREKRVGIVSSTSHDKKQMPVAQAVH